MQTANNKLLETVDFKQTTDWNIKQIASAFVDKSKFNKVPIGNCIKRVKAGVRVLDDQLYKRITIKTKGGGVAVRDEVFGETIKTKKQYRVTDGQLAVSKIDARNGAFGIVPYEASGAIITGNFWVFDIDDRVVNPRYLVLILSSKQFTQAWLECSNGSGNRLYLQEKKFLDYKIPIPPLDVQAEIIAQYENAVSQASHLIEECDIKENEMTEYLWRELRIGSIEKEKRVGILQQVNNSDLIKWGVAENLDAVSPRALFLSSEFDNVRLTSVASINPSTVFPKSVLNEEVSFVPMECVSDVYGEIVEQRTREVTNSKGYTRFSENDVLWAKITPCMQNGKCAIANGLQNGYGYGSTEFHVIRVDKDKALPEYIYCFLRTKRLRQAAKAYFNGSAGQQRVGAYFLEALTIPMIPLRAFEPGILTQEEIVSHVFLIKKEIRELREKAEKLLCSSKENFEKAVFG